MGTDSDVATELKVSTMAVTERNFITENFDQKASAPVGMIEGGESAQRLV